MNRLIIICAAALASGCVTKVTATKHAEQMLPVQRLAVIGTNTTVYTVGYIIGSGGWEATARSPLWAAESLQGLDIAVTTNGTVRLALADYHRDLSTNAVALTHVALDGAANLAAKVGAAIATSGGSAGADAIAAMVKRFVAAGGDASKAFVTCSDGSCTITDGATTCVDGVCNPR